MNIGKLFKKGIRVVPVSKSDGEDFSTWIAKGRTGQDRESAQLFLKHGYCYLSVLRPTTYYYMNPEETHYGEYGWEEDWNDEGGEGHEYFIAEGKVDLDNGFIYSNEDGEHLYCKNDDVILLLSTKEGCEKGTGSRFKLSDVKIYDNSIKIRDIKDKQYKKDRIHKILTSNNATAEDAPSVERIVSPNDTSLHRFTTLYDQLWQSIRARN